VNFQIGNAGLRTPAPVESPRGLGDKDAIASISNWTYIWTYTHPLMSTALVAVLYTIYIMPMFIASERNHKHVTAIVLFNIFTGWTFFGWVVSFVWALAEENDKSPR
jgi:hypothetical protein